MEDIIGLGNISKHIFSLKELPHSFALIGEEGSGKHLLTGKINDKFFNIPYLDISDSISDELIDGIYTYPQKRLYIIDVSKITEKDQNVILKFIEEPFENIYICLLTLSTSFLLPTVSNRVVKYYLDWYGKSILKQFAESKEIKIDDGWFGDVIRTPGDILKVRSYNVDLNAIGALTLNMVHNMCKASFPNALSIINKINFKDEFDKFDLTFFLRSLYRDYLTCYNKERNNSYLDCALIVNDAHSTLLKDARLDKKRLITNMLIRLWKGTH